jgi:hypothetical protein
MQPAGSRATWMGKPKAERAGANESTYPAMGRLASLVRWSVSARTCATVNLVVSDPVCTGTEGKTRKSKVTKPQD